MKKLVLLAVMGCVVSGGVAQAATYYASKAGSNGNSCAQAQSTSTPKLTIVGGLACLAAGDTLYVRGGTYDERINNEVIASGTSWANVTRIAAYPGETVWMVPTSGTYVVYIARTLQYIEFDGINMDSRQVVNGTFTLQAGAGYNPNHIRLKNAEMVGRKDAPGEHDVVNSGSHFLAGATGANEFINLKVHGGGRSGQCGIPCGGYGIYLAGPNNLVDHCDVYDTTGAGIHIYNGAGDPANNNIVRNTRIHHITRGYDARMWGILVAGSNNQVYNNVIDNISWPYMAGNAGVHVYVGSGNKIYNNTITNNTLDGIYVNSNASGSEVRNNIMYGNTGVPYSNAGSGTVQSNNLFGTDPRFVDPSAANFQLQSGSAAIDAGMSLSIVTTDIIGVPRPEGPAPDIGAFEYRSSQAVPLAPTNVRIITN